MGATDVISLPRAKVALGHNLSDGSQDALLGAYIGACSQEMDRRYGPIIARTVTETLNGSTFAGSQGRVRTTYWPVMSFTTITEYEAGAGTLLAAESVSAAGDYYAEPFNDPALPNLFSGWLSRRSGWANSRWATNTGNLVVVYEAGRYATTAAAQDSRYERCAEVVLRWWWHSQDMNVNAAGPFDVPALSFPTGWPNVVDQILSDSNHGLVIS